MQHAKAGVGVFVLLLLVTACSHQPEWSAQNQATLAAVNLIDSGSVCTADHVSAISSSFFVLVGVGLLTGFSHCIGMCGPLVGAFTIRRRAVSREITTPLLHFQLGRLSTYGLLGLAAGSLGYLLTGLVRDWQGVLAVALGMLAILLGLGLLGLIPIQHWLAATAPTRQISRWIKFWMSSEHPFAPFSLGLANGLLPCGPVYAVLLLAAVSGDPLKGASLMLIFGLGTLPAMLGLGFSTSWLSIRLRSHLYRAAALLIVAVGLQLMLRGLALHGQIPHVSLGSVMLW